MTRTKDALRILDRSIEDDPKMRRMIAHEEVKLGIGNLVHDARTAARLTQVQLARRIGTTQSVISRLEDADYSGHSLTMLQRVADALDLRLEVHLGSRSTSRRRG